MENTQEIKTVSYEEYSRELSKLQRKYRGCRSLIEIFEMGNTYDIYEKSPIQVSVNWSSIGAVSIEEAKKFARTLSEALEDCGNFKYNGYVIDWATPSERNH